MTANGSRVLLGVAAVLAGTTVLLGVFGLVYNPVLLLAAAPFGAATYFVWSSATGRMDERLRERVVNRADAGAGPAGGGPRAGSRRSRQGRSGARGDGSGRSAGHSRRRRAGGTSADRAGEETPSRSTAAEVLGVDPGADEAEVRRAFREKAREHHPDAPDGDEAAFRRVRTAYERLTDGR